MLKCRAELGMLKGRAKLSMLKGRAKLSMLKSGAELGMLKGRATLNRWCSCDLNVQAELSKLSSRDINDQDKQCK